MEQYMLSASFLLAAFLFGSVPWGAIIGQVFFRVDLRSRGSGNIGAANALRTIGKGGAAAVLLLDALKGYLPVLYLVHYGTLRLALAAAIAAVLGHCFTPWLGWRGGKGVATALGTLLALSWPTTLACVVVYIGIVGLWRISALGSLGATAVGPIGLFFADGPAGALYGLCMLLLLLYTHRSNLERLFHGKEYTFRANGGDESYARPKSRI